MIHWICWNRMVVYVRTHTHTQTRRLFQCFNIVHKITHYVRFDYRAKTVNVFSPSSQTCFHANGEICACVYVSNICDSYTCMYAFSSIPFTDTCQKNPQWITRTVRRPVDVVIVTITVTAILFAAAVVVVFVVGVIVIFVVAIVIVERACLCMHSYHTKHHRRVHEYIYNITVYTK